MSAKTVRGRAPHPTIEETKQKKREGDIYNAQWSGWEQ